MRSRSIARRMVAAVVSIVVLALGCSAAAWMYLLKRNFELMAAEELAAGAEAVRLKIQERVGRAELTARFIARDIAASPELASDADALAVYLKGLKAAGFDADLLSALDMDGATTAHAAPDWAGDMRGEPAFLDPLFSGAASGVRSAGVAVCLPEVVCVEAIEAFYLNGTKAGYVRVGHVLDDGFAREIKLATGTDYLLLRRGRGAAGSISFGALKTEESAALAGAVSSPGAQAASARLSLGGKPYFIKTIELKDAAGRVAAQQAVARGASDIQRAEREALAALAAISLLGLAFALALGLLTSKRIFGPLGELMKTVREVSEGRLDARVPDGGRDDEIGELSGAFNDMTRSLLDRAGELERRQAQLIQSGKLAAIGELAAGVAHEIGNPLSAISGYAQMIQENAHSREEHLRFASEIEREADFIVRIISDLLEFSRPSGDELKAADIRELCDAAVRTVSAHKAFTRVEIISKFAPDIPLVECHPKEIQQVFMNLIMNAAQAMNGEGRIRVEGALAPDRVLISVRDEGPGVPLDIKDKIFDPFFTTKPPGVGTGLGLSIAYRIVEKHGGRLELESSASGTAFSFALPLKGAGC